MRRNRVGFIIVLALASGLLAGYSALQYLQSRPTSLVAAEAPGVERPVVVAARDIPLGALLDPEDLTVIDWPSEAIPAGFQAQMSDLVGRAAIAPMRRNEPILETKLAGVGSSGGLPAVIPDGMRALSVRVDEVVGVAGFVTPGTRVDVLVTLTGAQASAQTKSILQNIQTLAAGQVYQQDPEGNPQAVTVVTLLVSPEEAEILTLASNQGRIQMALRASLDLEEVETRGVRVTELFRARGGGGTQVRRAAPTIAEPSSRMNPARQISSTPAALRVSCSTSSKGSRPSNCLTTTMTYRPKGGRTMGLATRGIAALMVGLTFVVVALPARGDVVANYNPLAAGNASDLPLPARWVQYGATASGLTLENLGGGPFDNDFVMPVGVTTSSPEIDLDSWQTPEVFAWLQSAGNIEEKEMLRTFNCGVGMVLVVDESDSDACISELNGMGENAWKIGRIGEKSGMDAVVFKP